MFGDPGIGPRLARGWHGLSAQLHAAIGVGHAAGFFRPGGGGQHHVGQAGGLGQKDVLYHQMLQPGQGLAGMGRVGVAHGGVFALDQHGADLPVKSRVDDLHHSQAGLAAQRAGRHTPKLFGLGAYGGLAHALVVGQHHGNQARIAGALHVVLPAQRVQAGAGAPNLPGDERQGNEAARVVGAVGVLAHAHAPQNHAVACGGVGAGHLAQGGGVDAAHRGHGFGRKVGHMGLELGKVQRVLLDVRGVRQAFKNDGVQHRVEQGHVGARLKAEVLPRKAGQLGSARVGHHQLRATLHRVFDPGGAHRVVLRGVGADDEHEVGVLHIAQRVGDHGRPQAFHERGHAGGMAQPGAVVHVVRAKRAAYELLKQVGLFVGALGRAKTRHRPQAPARGGAEHCALEAGSSSVQRFVPAGLAEQFAPVSAHHVERVFGCVGTADQRLGQAFGAVGVVKTKTAFHAEPAFVGRAGLAFYVFDLSVGNKVGQLAAHATKRAERIHLLLRSLGVRTIGRCNGTGGAGLHTFTASHAGAGTHGVALVKHDLRMAAAKRQTQHVVALRLAAGADAARALDAGVQVDRHGRVAGV